MSRKFSFSDWNKPLKKEESALFNPKVAAQKIESKKKPLRTKLLESNELGRTWVPRSGSSKSALHSHGRSQLITKQTDVKIGTTGSVKKPRDMPETKKRKTSPELIPSGSKSKVSLGIHIGANHEIFSQKVLLSSDEKKFLERLKNQRNLMKCTIVRDSSKPIDVDFFKRRNDPKLNEKQIVNKFEDNYEESASIMAEHLNFFSKLEERVNVNSMESKSMQHYMLNGKSDDGEIITHRIGNSSSSFNTERVKHMDEVKKLAEDKGLTILNGWKFPGQAVTRISRQFDNDGICLYCRTHEFDSRMPHNNCPYKTCPCPKCLTFDAMQAMDDISDLASKPPMP
uniref:Uncharacterized protein n=1 Tax=Acrobeloides nanus TaxID=290746 RepID=A0A914EAX8_9BILA